MSNKVLLTSWCSGSSKASWIDFNNDGKLDLSCNGNDGTHQVLLNNGDLLLSITGNVTSQLTLKLASNSTALVLSGWCSDPSKTSWIDFNNDHKLDLACNSNTHHLLLNDGNSLLSMTGDNSSQLVVKLASNLVPVASVGWCSGPSKTAWIDFNNDGKLDLSCNGNDGTHRVLLNNGDSLLSITGDITSQLVVRLASNATPVALSGWCIPPSKTSWIDFNNDGKPDLSCNGNDGTHQVLLNNVDSLLSITGDMTSQLAVKLTSNSEAVTLSNWCTYPSKTSWIDFNNDGKLDLSCNGNDGTHQVLLNNGDSLLSITGDIISQLAVKLASNLAPVALSGWCTHPSKTDWIDFNNDGKPDLACNYNDGTHRVLLNNGNSLLSMTGDITSQLVLKLASNLAPVALTGWCTTSGKTSWIDFNNDGKVDLACNGNDGTHRVLLNNGGSLLSMTGDITSQLVLELDASPELYTDKSLELIVSTYFPENIYEDIPESDAEDGSTLSIYGDFLTVGMAIFTSF